MRRKLIAGNWKMNGSLAKNASLLNDVRAGVTSAAAADVLVCVPAPYLAQAQQSLQGSPVLWGAQDVSAHSSGAYTGEVAAAMLKDFGVTHAIVGHSERRAYHAETNEHVAEKALQAIQNGLTAIVCVGETLEQRENGATFDVVGGQLKAVLNSVPVANWSNLVVAYEPVWAIGTGKTATPEMAQEVHAALRQQLQAVSLEAGAQVKILYGGSMKPENARELMAMADIDGGLIGGAALKAQDFLAILAAV